ncbi:hypothetical protein PIB30_108348 [Stylosanthes scabra]|uniref:Uncharacterized protein n=1 Tax=Stylosanthes scabra TaxID=79078 RepID=A0ABU6T1R9_9FABA|nr:hypothetical protein [Stylosanthes scabra]
MWVINQGHHIMIPTPTLIIPVGEITPISAGEAIKGSKGNGTTTILKDNHHSLHLNLPRSNQAEKETTTIPIPRPKPSSGKPKPLSKFLQVFSCLEVNAPLLKNLSEMPTYVHSLKELLLKKRSLKKGDTVVMT